MVVVVDIVTGATQGIGRAVAAYLALHHQADLLVLTGRNLDRGAQAASACDNQSSKLHALFEPCDQSRYSDVVQLKDRITKYVSSADGSSSSSEDWTVGILVNAAGECPVHQELVQCPQRQANGEIVNVEIDKQFATNVLGYHFMTKVFADHFSSSNQESSSTQTHVVNIASNWAGNLDLDDLHFMRRGYDNDAAYRQSKQCNRMLSVAWAEEFSQEGQL